MTLRAFLPLSALILLVASPALLTGCAAADAPVLLSGRVVFVTERHGNPDLYLYDLDADTLRPLLVRPEADYPVASIPGSGDLLVHAAHGDGAAHREALWRYDFNEETLMPLRLASRVLRHPILSPDGRLLVFEADFASMRDLYRYDFATDSLHRLTDHPHGNFDPSFAPDGQRLTLASSRESQAEVYMMPVDGEGPGGEGLTRLTAFHRDDWAPRWSPAGDLIAFLSTREGPPRLFLVAPDGSGQRRLLSPTDSLGADFQEGEAVWSPDGRFVAFEVLPRQGGAQLWVSALETGQRWQIAPALASASQPAWHPDGGALLFSAQEADGNADLYAARRDGTGLRRLTNHPAPDWLPRWLAAP